MSLDKKDVIRVIEEYQKLGPKAFADRYGLSGFH
jgi:hypothetical protein